jgi:hypothetical protein
MKPPKDMTEVINRKHYSTATSTLLAGNDYWDGSNFERSGRNEYLYRTPNGAYFTVNITQWQGERDTLTPLSEAEAVTLFEILREKRVSFVAAFPGVKVQDA